MQNSIGPQIRSLRCRLNCCGRAHLFAAMAATLVIPAIGNAQPSATVHRVIPQTKPVSKRAAESARRHRAIPSKPVQVAQATTPQAAPAMPQWPVNDPAQQALVRWTAQGLSIDARNSSLRQILDSVQSQTGVKIQGFEKDERVFGIYGPGQPREVLTQLLEGTDYNLLMVGNGENGIPQQIVLSAKPTGGPQPNPPVAQGDTYEPPIMPYESTQPQTPVMHPTEPPRTPQQILQEMQQRELMMRQQQIQQERQRQEQQQQ